MFGKPSVALQLLHGARVAAAGQTLSGRQLLLSGSSKADLPISTDGEEFLPAMKRYFIRQSLDPPGWTMR